MWWMFSFLWSGLLALLRGVFGSAFLGVLVGFLTSKLFQFLGMSVVFYTGVDVLLNFVNIQIMDSVSGLSGQIYDIVVYIGLFHGFSMVFAAYTLKFARKQATLIFSRN